MSELSQKAKKNFEKWQEFLNDPEAHTQRNYSKYEQLYNDIQIDPILEKQITKDNLKNVLKIKNTGCFYDSRNWL